VPDDRPISVLILYAHPLLGEGLAGLFSSEPGLDVVAVKSDDAGLVERGLAASPDVVIFERGDPDRAVEILESVPGALLIDVGMDAGPTFTYHRQEIPARPEGILELIRTLGPVKAAAPDTSVDARPSGSGRTAAGVPVMPGKVTAGS
jgi:DNA-binding NarL/FixJ family response regulator